VTTIPLTIGLIVGRSLVSILGSREIPFPGSRMKIETSLVNIPKLKQSIPYFTSNYFRKLPILCHTNQCHRRLRRWIRRPARWPDLKCRLSTRSTDRSQCRSGLSQTPRTDTSHPRGSALAPINIHTHCTRSLIQNSAVWQQSGKLDWLTELQF